MSKIIDLKGIVKDFGDTKALNNVDLYITEGEFLTLLGPSGCGKTTLLRIIGGFESADSGDVIFEGKRINDVPPHKRKVNTIFQKYALFPNMNVEQNIAFPLTIKKVPKKTIKEKVKKMLALVELSGFEKRNVSTLSGGQQQRVAIARALINDPEILLLDEPLAALDLKLRKEMQIELKNIQQQLGITFIFVTHDQEEALTMSDTVVVMKDGVIQQIGTPEDVYNEPKNKFVADFIGESNIIDGIMHHDCEVEFCNVKFKCVDKGFAKDEAVDVVLRPEDIILVDLGIGDEAEKVENKEVLLGKVLSVNFKGVHYEMVVEVEKGDYWLVHSTNMVESEHIVEIQIRPDLIHIMKKSDVSLAYEEENNAEMVE